MNVILDTNILRADIGARSGRFDVLRDYLTRTKSALLIPRIVFDELLAVYSREVIERASKSAAAASALADFLPHRVSELPPSIGDVGIVVREYGAHILSRLGVSEADLVAHSGAYLDEMLNRAIWRKPPCTDRGEELRDTLIWLIALDAAANSKDKQVAFVSANVRQFGGDGGELHPALEAEAKARGVAIRYFRSLDAFAREHASQIPLISAEWLARWLPQDQVLDAANWALMARAEALLEDALESGEAAAGEARILDTTIEAPTWYVNEMVDGSIRLEVTYPVTIEIEGPIWKSVWRQRFSRTYEPGMYGEITEPAEFVPETERSAITLSRDFEVVVEGEIRDGELAEWDVMHVGDA